ncbi:MAG: helix-turn-helix domain-containing protein, partial [Lautropia sp.]
MARQQKSGNSDVETPAAESKTPRPLMVRSVEKAMKMLEAFGAANPVMGLTQLASVLGVDK